MFPFGFPSKRRTGLDGGRGVRAGAGDARTEDGSSRNRRRRQRRSVFASPSQRLVAVVSAAEVTFWSGDPSRACAVARWIVHQSTENSTEHESRALVRHLAGCSLKTPCSAEWRHDERCVAFLYEKGFLLVLTLHPSGGGGSGAGGAGIFPDSDDALAGLPAWASSGAAPASHYYHLSSAYPRALFVSSTTYNIGSSKNCGFTPTCLLETADRLLFGGGPAGCLEYMYWNDTSIPPGTGRALSSQDGVFQDLKAHSVDIEGWGVVGGGGGLPASDGGGIPNLGGLAEMCAFKGGSRSSTASMVGYVTTGAVAGMLFLRWDEDKATNMVIHPKNASTLRFCSTNYRIAVGGADGKITIYQLLCPRSLRRETMAQEQRQGQGQARLVGQGQKHPHSMLATGPTDIEWCELNVIDIAALVLPSVRWEGGGSGGGGGGASGGGGVSGDGVCAIQSLSWSPSGAVIACAASGVSSAATGVAAFVASSGARLLWHFGSESADLEGASGSIKTFGDGNTIRDRGGARRLTWQRDVCWVQHGHQLMVHSRPAYTKRGASTATDDHSGASAATPPIDCASPSEIPVRLQTPPAGRRVHSILNEDKRNDIGPPMSGSRCAFPRSSSVDGAATATTAYTARPELVTIPFLFAPTSCTNNVHHNTASRLWLQGARRMFRFSATNQAPSRFRWRPLIPPDRYLGANLPIRSFAVSDCEKWLAVAGRRGFTICFLPVLRWSVFGNINHEQRIRSDGLMWWVPGQLLISVQSDSYPDSSGGGGGGGVGGSSRGSRSSSRDFSAVDLNVEGKGVFEGKLCFWSVQNGLGESGLLFTLPLDPNWRVHGLSRVGTSDTLLVLVALRLPARGFFLYRLLTVEVTLSRVANARGGGGGEGGGGVEVGTGDDGSESGFTKRNMRGTPGLGEENKAAITGLAARIVRMVRLPRSSRITTSFCVPVEAPCAAGRAASDTLHFAFICLTSEGTVLHFPLVLPWRVRPHVWGVALVNGNGKNIGAPFEGPVERLWPFTTTAISTLPSSVSSRHGSEHHHHHSLHMHPSSAVAVAATVPPFIASSCWAYGKDFGLKMWSPRCGAEDAAKDMSSSSSSSSSSSNKDQGDHAQAFGFDAEFTPLGPIPGLGCVVGLCEDPFRSSSRASKGPPGMAATCFEQRTQSRPCLHAIISAALNDRGDWSENLVRARDTARYAARFCPDFAAVGEMVLRNLLEQAYRDRKAIPAAPSGVILQRALRLLRALPEYEDAVMRCARKAEQTRWPYLFPVAGTPTALFARSVELGQLHVAASYLMIIANVDMDAPSAAADLRGAVSLHARQEIQFKYANVQEAMRLGAELMSRAKDCARSDLEMQIRMYLERLAIVGKELQTNLRSM